MLATWITGLVTGLSLIIVIGVQNALVLRQGLRREHVGIVVLVCCLGYLLLIAAGTGGMGAIANAHPSALAALSWIGAAYLLWCAYGSFRSALKPATLDQTEPRSRSSVLGTVLAVTFLNPHVYLDTVLMLGSIANQHGVVGRWWFAGGAMTASLVWFTGLGLGARALAPKLSHPRTWQVIDVVVGVTMLVIAALLVFG